MENKAWRQGSRIQQPLQYCRGDRPRMTNGWKEGDTARESKETELTEEDLRSVRDLLRLLGLHSVPFTGAQNIEEVVMFKRLI